MATHQHLWAAGLLQSLQRRVRHRLAHPQLGSRRCAATADNVLRSFCKDGEIPHCILGPVFSRTVIAPQVEPKHSRSVDRQCGGTKCQTIKARESFEQVEVKSNRRTKAVLRRQTRPSRVTCPNKRSSGKSPPKLTNNGQILSGYRRQQPRGSHRAVGLDNTLVMDMLG
jgi:hypothetical protein